MAAPIRLAVTVDGPNGVRRIEFRRRAEMLDGAPRPAPNPIPAAKAWPEAATASEFLERAKAEARRVVPAPLTAPRRPGRPKGSKNRGSLKRDWRGVPFPDQAEAVV